MLQLEGTTIRAEERQLLDERPSIEVGALAVAWAGEPLPELREMISFSLVLGEATHGPYRAEVVHQAGRAVGLHLLDESMEDLLTLMKTLEELPRGHPALPRASQSQLLPALMVDGAPEELEQPLAEEHRALRGTLEGRLGVGILEELLEATGEGHGGEEPGQRTSLLALLRHLAACKSSGKLSIEGRFYTKEVWLQEGVLLRVDVDPVKEDELLGQILLKARWISPQQLAGALRWGRSDGASLGSTMVRTGFLEQKKLARALAHQTYRRLRDLFDWREASFVFEPGPTEGYQTPMSVERLAAELALDVLRATPLSQLNLLAQVHSDCFPQLSLELSPERFKLLVPEEKTRRVCEQIFDGSRPLRLALKSSVLGRQRTVRLVLYLAAAGALDFGVDAVGQTLTPAQQLSERLRTLGVQDAFQRLGLRYWDHHDLLEGAHRQRAKDFVEGSLLRRASPTSADQALAMLDEAKMLLATKGARRKYRTKTLGTANLQYLAELVAERLLLAELHDQPAKAHQLREVLEELCPQP